ncbi:hypothetical protein [Brevibacterium sp. RIT 803]|uniref:hypothetical protein n=1 Tax=Brevibacterium sp. RIT 803 TaxID=2810210 RepID=UPI00207A31BD|nr:hypothetical protein [Brevibacterium sp. RIT 803]
MGNGFGGRKPSRIPEQVARAMEFLDTTDMTGNEVARAVGMSKSTLYAHVARRRAELEQFA